MELRVTPSSAFPLNLPADLAMVTVPEAFAPKGITCLPPTITGSATEASKWSPELLVLELIDWSIVATMTVPASTTIGCGAAAGAVVFFGSAPEGLEGVEPRWPQPHRASSTAAVRYRVSGWYRILLSYLIYLVGVPRRIIPRSLSFAKNLVRL